MEKYWGVHPKVIYATETIKNPFYETICKDIPFENWSKRIRETLEDIDDDQVLLMVDDCFIRKPVDTKRIEYLSKHLTGNMAMINFEKSFDINDEETEIVGVKKRRHGSPYEVSLLCGLWQREKLIKVLDRDLNCWEIEIFQDNKGFDYYINSGDFIIDWGYSTYKPAGIYKGKWCREVVSFFEEEGLKVDYSKKGFCD